MRPDEVFRAWVLVLVRDAGIPAGGVYLTIWLAQHGLFEVWQLPLLAGMMMVPLVGRATNGGDEE